MRVVCSPCGGRNMETRKRLQTSGKMEHEEKHRRDVAGKRPAERGSLRAEPSCDASRLDFYLWLLFTAENWLLDFGRPIYGLYISVVFPLSLPGIGTPPQPLSPSAMHALLPPSLHVWLGRLPRRLLPHGIQRAHCLCPPQTL